MADWHRLGQYVTARRVALGYRRREDLTAAVEGVGQRTLGSIETGEKGGYHRSTLATLERALRWAPGSIQAVLDGGEPTELPGAAQATGAAYNPTVITSEMHPADAALIKIMRNPHLSDAQKARIARTLITDQERYAAQRADELIAQARDEN